MNAPPIDNDRRPEIIIVRRKRMEDDGHHGGAWKIAFADFMTAMMALFLVLWLINAANEETRKSVASYFNPVKLVDRNRSERGLTEASGPSKKKVDSEQEDQPAAAADQTDDAAASQQATKAFFDKPEEMLDELARQARDDAQRAVRLDGSSSDELRDPFSNVLWQAGRDETGDGSAVRPARRHADDAPTEMVEPPPPAPQATVDDPGERANDERTEPGKDGAAEALEQAIEKALETVAPEARSDDVVKVQRTPEGLLISVVETPDFAMFRTGSAVPEGRLVLLLEEISGLLEKRFEPVDIHGHTDALPFRGGAYDNWRLSTDRAHSARLMLLRGSLGADRLRAVSGFAASRPLDGRSAEDPSNRRIEILLRTA